MRICCLVENNSTALCVAVEMYFALRGSYLHPQKTLVSIDEYFLNAQILIGSFSFRRYEKQRFQVVN